jgi:Helix-turn-helix domain
MPTAAPLPIAPDDLAILRRWACASQLPAVLVQRAKILLLAAEGIANTEAAERVGVTRQTVLACRRCYRQGGLGGLPDRVGCTNAFMQLVGTRGRDRRGDRAGGLEAADPCR